jgi:DNA-binding NarL/FixJ family response regulator
VIVADVSMPQLDGFSALQQLKVKCPDVKVILISMFHEPAFVNVALEWGASGFVSKIAADRDLIPAVHAAMSGKTYSSSRLTNDGASKTNSFRDGEKRSSR